MKRHIKLIVIFLCIIYFLCGCSYSYKTNQHIDESIVAGLQYNIKKMPYTVYFQKEVELSPYEPLYGAYLGAYVLSNPEIDFDMTQFEEAVGKNMAMALRHYQMGEEFPNQWLLLCLAQRKSPYIIITPPNMKKPYDKKLLEQTAQQFKNTYNIPVFIEFYSNPKEFGDPREYISYFQLAKEIFAEHAPNTVFVWSMDMENIYDSMIYYPGDDYVDWIGVSMYFPIYKNEQRYNIDIQKNLDYFYNMYQSKKPLLISKLAVSHYSKKGHTFYIAEAKSIIDEIYSQIPIKYPRIKGINYIDIDNIRIAPDDIGNDNFTVSTEPKMAQIFKEAIGHPYYLEKVEESGKHMMKHMMKMRTPIYEWNNHLYVSEETILYDWEINMIDHLQQYEMIIDDQKYYKLDDIVKVINYKYVLNGDVLKIYSK